MPKDTKGENGGGVPSTRAAGAIGGMEIKLRVEHDSGDPHRTELLAEELTQEIQAIGVASKRAAGKAPVSSKGMAQDIANFVVNIGPSVITPLLAVVSSWVSRPANKGSRVLLEVDGAKLNLQLDGRLDANEQRRLLSEAKETLVALAETRRAAR